MKRFVKNNELFKPEHELDVSIPDGLRVNFFQQQVDRLIHPRYSCSLLQLLFRIRYAPELLTLSLVNRGLHLAQLSGKIKPLLDLSFIKNLQINNQPVFFVFGIRDIEIRHSKHGVLLSTSKRYTHSALP